MSPIREGTPNWEGTAPGVLCLLSRAIHHYYQPLSTIIKHNHVGMKFAPGKIAGKTATCLGQPWIHEMFLPWVTFLGLWRQALLEIQMDQKWSVSEDSECLWFNRLFPSHRSGDGVSGQLPGESCAVSAGCAGSRSFPRLPWSWGCFGEESCLRGSPTARSFGPLRRVFGIHLCEVLKVFMELMSERKKNEGTVKCGRREQRRR